MAHSLPLVAPSNFILKLKIHCSKCEHKLKRMLQRVAGVHSVSIDQKQGTVAISGTVEPSTIMMFLEKGLGRKAELLWEQSPSSSSTSSTLEGQNLQIITESKVVDERFNDPNVVAQLEQLSGIQGLKNIQVTYSKTIKLTFQGEKDDLSHKNVEVPAGEAACSPQIHQCSGIICGSSASCCCGNKHGGVNKNVHGICGSCENHVAGYPIGSYVCPAHNCNGNSYFPAYPPAPEPPWPGCSPSAPPLWSTYDTPPPPPPPTSMGYSYCSPFSDDNPSAGCNII